MTRICDGCNVREPWEHRCHGKPCPCEECREADRFVWRCLVTTIPLPWAKPPITLNPGLRSENPHVKNRRVQAAKDETVLAIRAQNIAPMAGAIVWLHYQVPDYIRRDADNLAGTLKVVQDALVVAGVLHEDSWVTVPASGCRIHPPIKGQPGRLWVTLHDPDEEP